MDVRLLINLKVIASVEPNQKLNTKSGHTLIIDGNESGSCFYRWLRADNRHTAVKRIGEILEEANIALRAREEHRARVVAQLKETRGGLVNLQTTYESDPTINAHFDVLLERIDEMML